MWTKEEEKEWNKKYYQEHKQECLNRAKNWAENNLERRNNNKKLWDIKNKDLNKIKKAEYYNDNKEELNAKHKEWIKNNRDYKNNYSKEYLQNQRQYFMSQCRAKSRAYLNKYGQKIEGYQIHHCCTYAEPFKFIYCSREMHRLIHSYLRQHNISADDEHYDYIKHLLNDTVIKYNID